MNIEAMSRFSIVVVIGFVLEMMGIPALTRGKEMGCSNPSGWQDFKVLARPEACAMHRKDFWEKPMIYWQR